MRSVKKQPYLVAYPANLEGNGYYRIIQPIRAMKEAALIQGRVTPNMVSEENLKIMRPTLLWQLQIMDHHIESMKQNRKNGIFQIYELDDLILSFSDISSDNIHKKQFPLDLKARWRRIFAHIDRITVPTLPLKKMLDGVHSDVRVVPNLIPRAVLEATLDTVVAKHDKPTVGWMGGISHGGDLAVLKEVIDLLGDEVDWIFMGMLPPDVQLDGDHIKLLPSVPCGTHVQAFLQSGIDLALAPLERTEYNACKSNLRILEYGACGYPVLATDIDPYNDAPVFYPKNDTAVAWATAIAELCEDRDALKVSGDNLQRWVRKYHTLEDHLEAWTDAWYPPDSKFTEVLGSEAIENALWIGDTRLMMLPVHFYQRLELILKDNPDAGTLSFLSNDGEFLSYPTAGVFTPVNPEIVERVNKTAGSLDTVCLEIPFPVGPLVLITDAGLEAMGKPDTEFQLQAGTCMDYGLRVVNAGLKNIACLNMFLGTYMPMERDEKKAYQDAACCALRYERINVESEYLKVVQDYRACIETYYLKEWYSVMPDGDNDKMYHRWLTAFNNFPESLELDCVHSMTLGTEAPLPKNGYVAFIASDDVFHKEVYNATPHSIIAYCDEDYLVDGSRNSPVFKPAWDYALMLSHNYMGRGVRLSVEHVRLAGWTKTPKTIEEYHDLLFSVIEIANNDVLNVPLVGITLNPCNSGIYPVGNHLRRMKRPAMVLPTPMGFYNVQYTREGEEPSVSILIPTKDNADMLNRCVGSLLRHTSYENYEIIIIDNGTTDRKTKKLLQQINQHPKIKVKSVPCTPFNYSVVNNRGAIDTESDYLLLLNDDTEVLPNHGYWLDSMVRCAQYDNVGVVGAKLLYPNKTVQHTGVVIGMPFVADHKMKGIGGNDAGYYGQAMVIHEVSAVTGACMLISRKAWDAVKGLDPRFAVAYGDIQFCVKARYAGYRILMNPQAVLVHHESVSRGMDDTPEKMVRHLEEAHMCNFDIDGRADPFWSPNLSLTTQVSLAWPPRSPQKSFSPDAALVIGFDTELENRLLEKGVRYFRVIVSSPMEMTMVYPKQKNIPPLHIFDDWDTLGMLGITDIYLCDLRGATIEILWRLAKCAQKRHVLCEKPHIPYADQWAVDEAWLSINTHEAY